MKIRVATIRKGNGLNAKDTYNAKLGFSLKLKPKNWRDVSPCVYQRRTVPQIK